MLPEAALLRGFFERVAGVAHTAEQLEALYRLWAATQGLGRLSSLPPELLLQLSRRDGYWTT